MNLIKTVNTISLALLALLLSACSHTGQPVSDDTSTPEIEQKPVSPHIGFHKESDFENLPSVDLNSGLTYELLIAEFARYQGDYETAATAYLDAARKTRDPRLAKNAVQAALFNKDLHTAEIAAYFWVSITPDNPESNQSYASLLIQKGKLEKAEPYIKKVTAHTGKSKLRSYIILSNMFAKARNKQQALAMMDRLAADDRHTEAYLYASAQLTNKFSMVKETEQRLDELLQINPSHRNAMLMRARLYFQQGDTNNALSLGEKAVETHPDDNELRLFYGRLLVNTKQYSKGLKQFRVLSKRIKNNHDIRYSLGLLAMQAKEYDEAEIQFLTLIETDKRYVTESRQAMAQIAELRKDIPEAINWYKSVDYGSHYYSSQFKAAVLIIEIDGLEAAVKHLKGLEYQTPDDEFKGHLLEGELYHHSKLYKKAFAAYTRALKLKPNDTDMLYTHAMTAEKFGRVDILEKDLKHLLTIDPDNVQALNALGYTLADTTTRYEEAYSYISKAYKQKPDDAAILDSMGWVLYRMGKPEEAVKYLRLAAEKQQDGEISAHLGEVLWSMGQKDDAREVWNKALKFAPEHPVLLRTLKNFNP